MKYIYSVVIFVVILQDLFSQNFIENAYKIGYDSIGIYKLKKSNCEINLSTELSYNIKNSVLVLIYTCDTLSDSKDPIDRIIKDTSNNYYNFPRVFQIIQYKIECSNAQNCIIFDNGVKMLRENFPLIFISVPYNQYLQQIIENQLSLEEKSTFKLYKNFYKISLLTFWKIYDKIYMNPEIIITNDIEKRINAKIEKLYKRSPLLNLKYGTIINKNFKYILNNEKNQTITGKIINNKNSELFNLGIDYPLTRFIKPYGINYYIYVGIENFKMTGRLSCKNALQQRWEIDKDKQPYIDSVTLNDLNEELSISRLRLPVAFNFHYKISHTKLGLFVDFGVNINLINILEYNLCNGTGYYISWYPNGLRMDSASNYGDYLTTNITTKSFQTIKKPNVDCFFDLGLEYTFGRNNKWNFLACISYNYININYNTSLELVSENPNDYNSMINFYKKDYLGLFGLQFGFSYLL